MSNAGDETLWWYASDGVTHGPVRQADLLELRDRRAVDDDSWVWRDGLENWIPLEDSELRGPEAARRKPHPVIDPAGAPLRREDIGAAILYSIFTCGIYSFIVFYRCGRAYAARSGRASRFDGLFWGYVAANVIAAFFLPLIVVVIAVGAFLLWEVLEDREMVEASLPNRAPLSDPKMHLTLWISGWVLFLVGIGIPIVIYQAYRFLEDHNLLVAASGDRRAADAF
ncbi:MAG: GYF domain-containing protein [Planctomycetota bacterium]